MAEKAGALVPPTSNTVGPAYERSNDGRGGDQRAHNGQRSLHLVVSLVFSRDTADRSYDVGHEKVL